MNSFSIVPTARFTKLLSLFEYSLILRRHIVRPHLALADDRIDSGVVVLRRVLVLFQKVLNHLPHGGAGGGFLLPVDGAVFAEHLGQLSGQVDQLVVLVEVLDVLGLG